MYHCIYKCKYGESDGINNSCSHPEGDGAQHDEGCQLFAEAGPNGHVGAFLEQRDKSQKIRANVACPDISEAKYLGIS